MDRLGVIEIRGNKLSNLLFLDKVKNLKELYTAQN